MRNLIPVLVLNSSLIFINAVLGLQSSVGNVNVHSFKKHSGRAAKYDRDFWGPNLVSVKPKPPIAVPQVQSRALVVAKPTNKTLALPKSTKSEVKTSRNDDSHSIETKYHHSHSGK
jgi:hypothetical protein